jgi:triacylglycerol esterase/lipase EstA (alpha/beta hydrolase family)
VSDVAPPRRFYRAVRDQLGSLRRVYARGNRVVRHDDFAQKQEAVLLLHGFFQTRNVWEVMEDRLRYDGYGVFSFDLGGLFSRFNTERPEPLAERIAAKIERICARTGLESFHVIGHSKGGLIAREYVQHHAGDRRVRSLVTLGTPHHGTPTAALGVWLMGAGVLSRSPYDLLPNSGFLQKLRQAPFPSAIPLTSIYSRSDVVVPWWSSVLISGPEEAHLRNAPVDGVGHTALTYDPGVYRLVRQSLEAAHGGPLRARGESSGAR